MEVKKSSHSVYSLKYHVVWVCKYRRRILNPGLCSYIRKVLAKLQRSTPGVQIETIGFDHDHLHMLIEMPPKYSISSIMGRYKSQTSSLLRKEFVWMENVYWKENIVWSPGYFVSSVGINEKVIRNYVEYQGRQDSGKLRMEL